MSGAAKKRFNSNGSDDSINKKSASQKVVIPKNIKFSFKDLESKLDSLQINTTGKIFEFMYDSDQKDVTYKQFPMQFRITQTNSGIRYHPADSNGSETMYVMLDITQEQYDFMTGPFVNKIVDLMHANPGDFFGNTTIATLKKKTSVESQKEFIRDMWMCNINAESKSKDGKYTYPMSMKLKIKMTNGMPDLDVLNKTNDYEYWCPSSYYEPKPDQKVDMAEQAKKKEVYNTKVAEWKSKFSSPQQIVDMVGPKSYNDYTYDLIGVSVIGGNKWSLSGYLRQIRRQTIVERKKFNASQPGDRRPNSFDDDVHPVKTVPMSKVETPIEENEEIIEEEEEYEEEVEEEVEEDA